MPINYTKSGGQPEAAPPSKVTLTKAAPSVSLTKAGSASGVLRVNLKWNARPKSGGGLFKRLTTGGGIDLDLGALYEYVDGSKGAVQALGNAFRDHHSLGAAPITWLDGDDRTGASTGGENLFVDLGQLASIRRILIYTYIYEGAPNWAAAGAVVTLFPVVGPQVEMHLDEPDGAAPTCGIALLTNVGGELSVSREVRYIRGGQRLLSEAYGWGLQWTAGRK